jgi:hypothetical protein
MRFMIIVKATQGSEAGLFPPHKEKLFADMATYHEELKKAGMLLDASGLQPSSKGWRVRYSGGKVAVVDGPFPETKERVAGYTLIQAKSRGGALEWTKRFPNPGGRARPARSRCASCTSSRISARSRPSIAFARWESEPGNNQKEIHACRK